MALFKKKSGKKESDGSSENISGRHFGDGAEASLTSPDTSKVKTEATAEVQKKKDIAAIKLFLMRMAVFVGILFLLFGVMFNVVAVPDMSMKPKLLAGDLALVYRFDENFNSGNPVVYRKDDKIRFGRIVAKPGDSIEIADGGIKVNGSVVVETDIYYKTDPLEDKIKYPLRLGPDEYFILGDMREGARDSRYFGPIKKDEIIGKVTVVIRRSEI